MKSKGSQKGRSIRVPVQRVDDEAASSREDRSLDKLLSWRRRPVEMDRIERGPRRRLWPYLLIVLGVIFLATLAGFFVFNKTKGKFSEQGVTLTLQAPATTASGSQIDVTISYLNTQSVDLKSAELSVTYPEGFTVSSVTPASGSALQNSWAIGTVKSGYAGEVTVHGTLVGTLDSTKQFFATLTYRPANFNSDFSAKTEATTAISSSLVSVAFDGATSVVPEKSTTVAVKIKNTSDAELKNLKVIDDSVDGFKISGTEPRADEGESYTWTIDSLGAGAEATITLTGIFKGKVGERVELSFRIGLIDATGSFTLQNTANQEVTLVSPQLSVTVTLNGKADASVELGDQLVYQATFKNNGQVDFSDLTVSAQFGGTLFRWEAASASPDADLKDAAKGSVSWSKATTASLASLKSGQEGKVELTVPLVAGLADLQPTDKELSVQSVWKVTTAAVESLGGPVEATSEALVTKVRTTAKLSADARYYAEEGNAVGSGPLPPVVGQTTSYRVVWILDNGLNDLTDVTVQTTVPETTYWTGKVKTVSAGTLDFDPTTRTVTWKLNRVPARTGTATPELTAEFEVSVTPKAADVSLLMVLTEKTTLSATDAFTADAVTIEQSRLTTDLKNDVQARGKGIVAAS